MAVGSGVVTRMPKSAMLKKSRLLKVAPAPMSTRMKSAGSLPIARRIRCFRACPGLARSMKSVAPQMRWSVRIGVGTKRSSIVPTVFPKNSFSVSGGCLIPNRVWTLAPARSASTSTTSCPSRASAQATLMETRLLPTPPFPPPTAQIIPWMFSIRMILLPERNVYKNRSVPV